MTGTKNLPSDEDSLHIPVLLNEVLEYLAPQPGDNYLDLTAGYGGHAAKILERTSSDSHKESAVLVDRDSSAVRELSARFGTEVTVMHQDFASATDALIEQNKTFDIILADLGVSSPHLNQAGRGFSLAQDGPLDMRMDQDQELTAEKIVNNYPEATLANILQQYGEEPKARAIAHAIVEARPIRSTTELASIIARSWRGHSKVHPATRSFQAIRIAVNDELGLLEKSLPKWIGLLNPGGRIAVISFHSLEDRLVKRILAEFSGNHYDSEINLLTKRPITADHTELVFNPRARSAKLRAAAKIKNQNK